MRFLIFCPTWGNGFQHETSDSIRGLRLPTGTDADIVIGSDNPFPGADVRNILHQYSLARHWVVGSDEYQALLTVEHDMVIPPDTLDKMVATSADVVYGHYRFRNSKGTNALEWLGEGRELGGALSRKPELYAEAVDTGSVRVSGVGLGCTLIHKRVLERFSFHMTGGFAPDWGLAEDCQRANLVQVCRFDVRCGHVDRGEVVWPKEVLGE